MKDEIGAASVFLTRLIKKHQKLPKAKLEEFREKLEQLLIEHFRDHWFPENPFKGQAYRCIRVNQTERMDPILKRVSDECGLNYHDLNLPSELTLWVDPMEVCCRFGEYKGSYCTVAKFKNGNKENYAHMINIDHLEKRSAELAKQASAEIMSGFRRSKVNHMQSNTSLRSTSTPPNSKNLHNFSPEFTLHKSSPTLPYVFMSPILSTHPRDSRYFHLPNDSFHFKHRKNQETSLSCRQLTYASSTGDNSGSCEDVANDQLMTG